MLHESLEAALLTCLGKNEKLTCGDMLVCSFWRPHHVRLSTMQRLCMLMTFTGVLSLIVVIVLGVVPHKAVFSCFEGPTKHMYHPEVRAVACTYRCYCFIHHV